MNNTKKILIAIGVGVGIGYLYNRYKKGKTTKSTNSASGKSVASFELPEELSTADMTREEKEEYILDNVSATPQEVSSGFEGVRFVWNPKIEKMYPVGTIEVGQTPAYMDSVFNSAEGDVVSDIPDSVKNAETSLKDLNDQELELLFRITKTIRENPSNMTEEDAVKEMGITNPNVIKVVRQKLRKRLNDIKIMKTDGNWNAKWESRKETRRKRRKDFADKMGFDKGMFDKQVRKSCGLPPRLGKGHKASYKKCVQDLANKMRSQAKSEVATAVAGAPISAKNTINNKRQKSFSKQVTNRAGGGMFAGRRWDGESNAKIESLVDSKLV